MFLKKFIKSSLYSFPCAAADESTSLTFDDYNAILRSDSALSSAVAWPIELSHQIRFFFINEVGSN